MERFSSSNYVAYVDGGCPGNGRPYAFPMFGSYIIYNKQGDVVEENIKFDIHHPKRWTNNLAEVMALESLLTRVNNSGYHPIDVYMDSQLIVNQFNGVYRVKDASLKKVFNRMPKVSNLNLFWVSGDRMKEILGH